MSDPLMDRLENDIYRFYPSPRSGGEFLWPMITSLGLYAFFVWPYRVVKISPSQIIIGRGNILHDQPDILSIERIEVVNISRRIGEKLRSLGDVMIKTESGETVKSTGTNEGSILDLQVPRFFQALYALRATHKEAERPALRKEAARLRPFLFESRQSLGYLIIRWGLGLFVLWLIAIGLLSAALSEPALLLIAPVILVLGLIAILLFP